MATFDDTLSAILFDRDGTLIVDVAYNDDPERVTPLPTVAPALARLRDGGIAVGVVSNQSGIARGLLRDSDLHRVNARVDALLGPFDVWKICPHGPDDGCDCRKPRPGMIVSAAADLGVPLSHVAMVGDIGSDMEAAAAAGVRAVLVPTAATREEERRAAPVCARTLEEAVDILMPAPREAGR